MRLVSISDQSLRCVVRSSLSILTMALSKPRLWKKMSSEELRLAHIWFDDDGKTPREIAELLHRDKWSAEGLGQARADLQEWIVSHT